METTQAYISVALNGDGMRKTVIAKQGDSGTRALQFSFVANPNSTSVITLEENTEVKARFKLADGTSYEVEAEINTQANRATCTIPTEVMLKPGRVLSDVCLYQDDQLLSTNTFELNVVESAIGIAGGQVIIGGKFYNVTAMTREQFDTASHSENTIYLVDDSPAQDESLITLYMGDYQLASVGANDNGTSSVYTYHNIGPFHQRQAGLSSEIIYSEGMYQTFTLLLQRYAAARGDLFRNQYLKFYDDYPIPGDEETPIKSTSEMYADDVIRFKVGNTAEMEITQDGVFFNGKKLGGGSNNIGQSVGILGGTSSSAIGQAEEVEE